MSDQPYVMPPHMRLSPGEILHSHLEDQARDELETARLLGLSIEDYVEFQSGRLRLTSALAESLASVMDTPADYWWKLEASYLEALPHLREPSPALLSSLEGGDGAFGRYFLAEQVSKLIRLGMLREAKALLDNPEHQVLAEL